MTNDKLTNIYKWLWFTEVHYKNRVTDIKNNFNRCRNHTFFDYINLYDAERDYKNFLKFSKDLSIILGEQSK